MFCVRFPHSSEHVSSFRNLSDNPLVLFGRQKHWAFSLLEAFTLSSLLPFFSHVFILVSIPPSFKFLLFIKVFSWILLGVSEGGVGGGTDEGG